MTTTKGKRHHQSRRQATSKEWACRTHRVPAGERCGLCEDQLSIFDQPATTDGEAK